MSDYVMGEDGTIYETVAGQGQEFQTVGAGATQLLRSIAPAGGRPAPLTGLRLVNPAAARPAAVQVQAPPPWRGAIAPGVSMPGEYEEQLPLDPDRAGGIFAVGVSQITWSSRPQRPFRAERLVILVGRNGASAAGVLPVINPGIFIGTQLVGAAMGDTAVDGFGPNAFGVRLQAPQATPGMDVRIPITLRGALAGTDTITLSMFFIGRSIRLELRGRHAYPPCHSGQHHHAVHSGQRA